MIVSKQKLSKVMSISPVYILFSLVFISLSGATSLEELIRTANRNSPLIKGKEVELKAKSHVVRQKKASRFGEVSIYGAYDRYEGARILYPISVPTDIRNLVGAENQFVAGVSYSVPLFTGFRITKSVEIAKLDKTLKEIQFILTKNQVIHNLKVLYIKILSLQKQLRAFEEYKSSLDVLYGNIQQGVKEGKRAEVDLLKVDYERENAKATVEKLKSSIETLKSAIKTLVGRRDIDLSVLEDIKPEDYPPKEVTLSRIDILNKTKGAKIATEIAQKKLAVVKGEYLPKVFLKTYAQRNMGNGEYKDLWQVSVSVKYDLFDFGKRKHNYLEKSLEVRAARLRERQVELELLKDIDKAYNDIRSAEAKIEAVKKQVELARTVEEIEKVKYEEGVSDVSDYLSAKAKRYIAESLYYQALYEKEMAVAYLKYLLEEYGHE